MDRRSFGRGIVAALLSGVAAPAMAQPFGPPPRRRVCWTENRVVIVRDAWGRPVQTVRPIRVCAYR